MGRSKSEWKPEDAEEDRPWVSLQFFFFPHPAELFFFCTYCHFALPPNEVCASCDLLMHC